MAKDKKAAPAPKAQNTAPAKKRGKAGIVILMTLFGASVCFILPSLLFLVGMIPTLVELLFGNDRKGSSVTAIGVMNAAGIAPFLIELWQKGQTMPNAFAILSQPATWCVMFGAAAVGWLILFAVPQTITALTLARAEARIKLLKDNLEHIKMTWGSEVATTKPLERVARGD